MAIPKVLKDTMNWKMVGGLDEDGEAQGLTFDDDKVKVSASSDALALSIEKYVRRSTETQEEIIHQLRVMNFYLSLMTGARVKEDSIE